MAGGSFAGGFSEGFRSMMQIGQQQAALERQEAVMELARRQMDAKTAQEQRELAIKNFEAAFKLPNELAKAGNVEGLAKLVDGPAFQSLIRGLVDTQRLHKTGLNAETELMGIAELAKSNSPEAQARREAEKQRALIPVKAEELRATKKVEQEFAGAQTDIGKLIEDRQRFTRQYGEGSPQLKAFDEAATAKGAPNLGDVAGIRKEFTGLAKEFVVVKDAFETITHAAIDKGGAGRGVADITLITAYMKMLDPSSSVREGEFANAQNAGGVPDRVRNLYNRLLSGDLLNDEQRQTFVSEAETIFNNRLKGHVALEDQFKGIATRQGMPPENVVVDFVGPYRTRSRPKQAAAGADGATGGEIAAMDLPALLKALDDPKADLAAIAKRIRELSGGGPAR